MGDNGFGLPTTIKKIMAEHDALPPEMRRISCSTVAKWSAKSLAENVRDLQRNGMSYAAAVAELARWISEWDEPMDAYRTYGPLHPEANAHGKPLKPHRFACWAPGRQRRNA